MQGLRCSIFARYHFVPRITLGGGQFFDFTKLGEGGKNFSTYPHLAEPLVCQDRFAKNAHRTRPRAIPKKASLHEIFFLAT